MRLKPLFLATVCLLPIVGCKTPYEESDKKREAAKRNAQDDPTFQAFLGRLRIAIRKKDRAMLQTMMTPSFGYKWDETQAGDSVFTYWDLHNTWPVIENVLTISFVPHQSDGQLFMVAVQEPDAGGYVAGIQMTQGSWRFAYFVPPNPDEPAQPAQPQ